jgi:hypothetical protein
MQHERGTRTAVTSTRAEEDNQVGNRHSGPRNRAATADQRRSMIEVAAYLRAETRGFQGGSPVDDWVEAERETDAMLAAQDRTPHARELRSTN